MTPRGDALWAKPSSTIKIRETPYEFIKTGIVISRGFSTPSTPLQPSRPRGISLSNLKPPASALCSFTPPSPPLFSYTYALPNLQLFCFHIVTTVGWVGNPSNRNLSGKARNPDGTRAGRRNPQPAAPCLGTLYAERFRHFNTGRNVMAIYQTAIIAFALTFAAQSSSRAQERSALQRSLRTYWCLPQRRAM